MIVASNHAHAYLYALQHAHFLLYFVLKYVNELMTVLYGYGCFFTHIKTSSSALAFLVPCEHVSMQVF